MNGMQVGGGEYVRSAMSLELAAFCDIIRTKSPGDPRDPFLVADKLRSMTHILLGHAERRDEMLNSAREAARGAGVSKAAACSAMEGPALIDVLGVMPRHFCAYIKPLRLVSREARILVHPEIKYFKLEDVEHRKDPTAVSRFLRGTRLSDLTVSISCREGSSIVSEIVGSIGESLSTVKSVVFRDAFIPRTSRRSTQVSDASSVLARMLPNLCSLTIMGASAGNAMLAFGTHCRKLSHLTVDVVTVPPMTSDLQTPMLATYTLTDRVRYRSSTSATADDDTSHAFKGHILASPNVLRSTSVTGLHFEQRLLGGCLSISDVPPDILNDLPPSIREFSTTFELPSVLLAHGFLSPLTDLVIPGLSTQWEIYGLVQRIGHLKTLALFSSYMILPEVMYIIKSHPHVLIMCELVELRGSGAELAAVLKSLPTMDCQHCALHAVDSFDAVGLMELARIFPDLVQLSLSCPRAPSESCLASLRSPSLFALIVQTPIPFSQNGLVSLCDSLPRLGALITCVTDGMETHQLALEEIMMAKGRLVHCHESTGF